MTERLIFASRAPRVDNRLRRETNFLSLHDESLCSIDHLSVTGGAQSSGGISCHA